MSSNFSSTQKIPQSATEHNKLTKVTSGYIEIDDFKNSNLKKGFFCYNCIYWIDMSGGKCMIVDDKGIDVFVKTSDVIAAHGCCNGYEPDFDTINEKEKK